VTKDIAALSSRAATSGSSFYWPGAPGGPMPLVFEAGLPDPTTFPVDDLARLTALVLERDRDELQYGTPLGGDLSYGYYGLREQLAARVSARDGSELDPSSVLLTAGGGHAISLIMQAFLDAGDHAVVEAPTWEYPLRDIALAGAHTHAIPVDDDGLQVDRLEELIDELESRGERLKLVYTIATFNVPTGVCLSLERRRRLVELAREHEFIVIDDCVYRDLRYEGDHLPTLASLGGDGLVLTVESFSKTVMPALRLGWVSGHPDAIAALDRVRRDLGVSQLIARVVSEFVGEGRLDPHIAKVVELNRSKRDASLAALEEHCRDYMTWNRPPGGYFIWLELADHVDGRALQKRALTEGVVCRPGERFYGEPDAAHAHQRMRFAFTAVPTENLEHAIAILGKTASNCISTQ